MTAIEKIFYRNVKRGIITLDDIKIPSIKETVKKQLELDKKVQ